MTEDFIVPAPGLLHRPCDFKQCQGKKIYDCVKVETISV